jgi:hypothetical protein
VSRTKPLYARLAGSRDASQLVPGPGQAGEPAKHDSGPRECEHGKRHGEEIEAREWQTADHTLIESIALGSVRSSLAALPASGRLPTALPTGGGPGEVALLASRSFAAAVLPAGGCPGLAALPKLSVLTAPVDASAAATLIVLSTVAVPLDVLIDLLRRRGVLLQGWIEQLCARCRWKREGECQRNPDRGDSHSVQRRRPAPSSTRMSHSSSRIHSEPVERAVRGRARASSGPTLKPFNVDILVRWSQEDLHYLHRSGSSLPSRH